MTARHKVALVGGIYHADADKLLRASADVVALDSAAPRVALAAGLAFALVL